MKTMAEVLAEHQDWTYLIARNAMVCAGRNCGWTKELSEDETSRQAYLAHQAAALSAAGYGPVKEAAAGALRDAAKYAHSQAARCSEPVPVGCAAVVRAEPYGVTYWSQAGEYLRARAAALGAD